MKLVLCALSALIFIYACYLAVSLLVKGEFTGELFAWVAASVGWWSITKDMIKSRNKKD